MLIVRLDAIGDALTTAPLVAALRSRGLRVGAVLRERNAGVFAAAALDRVHVYRDHDLTAELAAEAYDCALIATEKPLGYSIAYAANIPARIGFENGLGKPLKTLWVRRMCTGTVFRTAALDPHPAHECETVFKLGQRAFSLVEPPRDPARLRPFVLDDVPALEPYIAIQITAKWQDLGASPHEICALIERVGRTYDLRLIGAQAERSYCDRIAAAARLPVRTYATLAPWKRAIAQSAALVAPDSGGVHVAGMIGTPVVACFASRDFALQTARWSPWASPYRTVRIQPSWPAAAAQALETLIGKPASVPKA